MAKMVHISGLRHIKVAGKENLYCGWPWTGNIHNFGGGELAVIFTEADCAYRGPEDIEHYALDCRGRQVLRRSLDHGESWPEALRVVIRDNAVPFQMLFPEGEAQREPIDMFRPESILCAWRSFSRDPWVTSDGKIRHKPICFILRSADKGYTWEKVPIIVDPGPMDSIYGGSHYLKMPDGTLLAAFGGYKESGESTPGRSALYGSPDGGLTWYYVSTIGYEFEDITCHYPCLLALPDGRIMCSLGYRTRGGSWTSIVYSEDEGLSWSAPRRINRWGDQAYLLLLRDRRVVCLYGYRYKPYGIRGKVSDDLGETWSREFVVREDGGSPDLGYPVATELEDGRIFTAYYFNVENGPRFIGGTFFNLEM